MPSGRSRGAKGQSHGLGQGDKPRAPSHLSGARVPWSAPKACLARLAPIESSEHHLCVSLVLRDEPYRSAHRLGVMSLTDQLLAPPG